ncbi:MAG: ABC transporter permease [Chloroflexi bacterium]|nr:MAG: ABC transporter permease [Chloroflexota bacterium]
MAEVTRSKSRVRLRPDSGLPSPEDQGPLIEQPLWRIRLRLLWRNFITNFRIFRENPIGLIGLAIILLFALMALLHPYLMENVWDPNIYDPVIGIDQSIPFHPAPPSAAHPLGTDPLGRDVLSQLMYGTRAAFVLGILAALVTVTIGTAVGALAAYYGGFPDTFFMRLADLIIMTPTITILLVMAALFDIGFVHLAVIIGLLSGFGGTTIIIKSQALTIKVRSYIEAARVAGGGDAHIIFRHIIPNLLPLTFLYMMFTVTTAIALEAILSFFGLLNIRMSWGLMIFTTQRAGYLLDMSKWWLIFPSGLAITTLCAAFYLVGRALDEVVNPRLRKR